MPVRLPPPASRRGTVEPIAPARYRVEFTAGRELRDKLERLRRLMRGSVPGGDLAELIDVAVTEKLARLEARKLGRAVTPKRTVGDTDTTPRSRHVPAAIRRAVWQRDDGQCVFRDASGHRCSARERLQFHHRHPFGVGGDHAVENVCLLCHAHNRAIAETDFGPRASRRERKPGTAGPDAGTGETLPAKDGG